MSHLQVSQVIHKHHLPLCFLIVSSPEAHICEAFEEPSLANIAKVLSGYGNFRARADVSTHFWSESSRIFDSKRHRDVCHVVRP